MDDILRQATLNMNEKRIINVAYSRDPVENTAYKGDVVTAKALNDFRKYSKFDISTTASIQKLPKPGLVINRL